MASWRFLVRLSRFAVAAAVLGASLANAQPSNRTVVVITFDALGDRFLDRDLDSLPNFRRMMTEGTRAPFRPEFPTKTFPNHYSMVTGLAPGKHGLAMNAFFDPARRASFSKAELGDGSWFGGEPIWGTAQRAGLKSATYFWPGSEAEIHGMRPTYWYPFDQNRPDSAKVTQIMRWLRLPAAERPRLIMAYSVVVDVAGHRYGPDSPQMIAAVRAADRTVGMLRDSLAALGRNNIDFIVVSDHGLAFIPREHAMNVDSLLPKAGAIVDNAHATLSIWQDTTGPKLNFDSLANVLRAKIPHARVFKRGEFPARWETEQNPRFGDLFILADPGYEFLKGLVYTLGEHGYDPSVPDMMGVFLAVGPDFRSGARLAVRENRTLHDLLIHLLNLRNPNGAAPLPDFGLHPNDRN